MVQPQLFAFSDLAARRKYWAPFLDAAEGFPIFGDPEEPVNKAYWRRCWQMPHAALKVNVELLISRSAAGEAAKRVHFHVHQGRFEGMPIELLHMHTGMDGLGTDLPSLLKEHCTGFN